MECINDRFLAEETLIKVIPNFKGEKLNLSSKSIGPFRPMVPAEVPLWVAVDLCKRGYATIQPPEWLNLEYICDMLEKEENTIGPQKGLPFYWEEIIREIQKVQPSADILYKKIQKLRECRDNKIDRFYEKIDGRGFMVESIGSHELYKLMGITKKSMKLLSKFNDKQS